MTAEQDIKANTGVVLLLPQVLLPQDGKRIRKQNPTLLWPAKYEFMSWHKNAN